jgi:hypothetical protein
MLQDEPRVLLPDGILRGRLLPGVASAGAGGRQPRRLPDRPAHRRFHPGLEKPGGGEADGNGDEVKTDDSGLLNILNKTPQLKAKLIEY